jgi:hypothetical protein
MFANGQRQTAILNYEISTICETKQKKTPQKVSKLLVGPEQVTMHEHCKLYDDDCFGNFGTWIVADKFSVAVSSASSSTSGTNWFVSEKT